MLAPEYWRERSDYESVTLSRPEGDVEVSYSFDFRTRSNYLSDMKSALMIILSALMGIGISIIVEVILFRAVLDKLNR